MKLILNLIRKYSGCCLNCGSFFPDAGCLCEKCEAVLGIWEFAEGPTRKSIANSLYRWEPGKSDTLSGLILWLKGSKQRIAWEYYAQKICRQYAHTLPSGAKIFVIPAPAKKPGQRDHAYWWAQGIAKTIGAEVLPCLRKKGEFSQRGADLGTRNLIDLEVIENSTEHVDFKSQTYWIFADDIVTSGATARAAHIAIGSPENFAVWTLAQRGLSCGASRDLL